MDVGKDKIKDLFSSKLGRFESEVPASVWGGLDQLLSAQPAPTADASSNASSSAGKSSLLKVVITVIGLTAAVAMGIFFLNKKEDKVVLEEPDFNEHIVATDSIVVSVADSILIAPVIASYTLGEGYSDPAPIQDEPVEFEEEIAIVEEEKKEEIIDKKENPVRIRPKDEVHVIPLREEEKGKGLLIGIMSDLGLSSYTKQDIGGYMLLSHKVRTKEFLDALDVEESEFVLKHSKPISFGVTFEKQLSSKFSLETGVVYTSLSSELTSANKYNIRETQSFNYIGVPITLNYTFYKVGGGKFYLAVGGMMQKDIKGKYVSYLDLPKPKGEGALMDNLFYKEPYYIKKDLKQTNPQISVRSKLGVMFPLYKKLYIYSAIGGIYYFDANNKYRTIYSDKKTQLDLDLGVKYEF